MDQKLLGSHRNRSLYTVKYKLVALSIQWLPQWCVSLSKQICSFNYAVVTLFGGK